MGSIYKITNTVNGKSYIGKTTGDAVKTRIRDHLSGKGNEPVRDGIAKYGKEAFTYEILHDGILPEFLNMLEIEAIAKFNTIAPNGYNLTAGGEGGTPSAETRRKLCKANTGKNNPMYGKTHSEETLRKMSDAHKGKTFSKETCRKLSENNAMKRLEVRRKCSKTLKGKYAGKNSPNYGKTHSEETLRKISDARRSEYYNPARIFFYGLPETLTLREKRKRLFAEFPEVTKRALYNWVRKWISTS